MPIDVHTVQLADGSTPTSFSDRLQVAFLPGVATPAAAEGASATVAISGLTLPASYAVHATPSQPAIVSVSAKTFSGFTLTLTPISSTETLSAGTVDVIAVA
jgi:hypothetical protein